MSTNNKTNPPKVGKPTQAGPAARISRRAHERLRAGHLWIYRSDLDELHPAAETTAVPPGAIVTVLDPKAAPIGSGIYSSASEIAVRLVSTEPALDRAAFLQLLRVRLTAAIELRQALGVAPSDDPAGSNAARLAFAEADNLPGIVIDRYNDLVIVQLLTQATAQDDVRAVLTAILSALPGVATVLERPDPRVRELEQLAPVSGEPLFASTLEPALDTVFILNGLRFGYDAAAGQKTGAFLDQRHNYQAAARYAHGRALDCCTYQGGFALHLARVCQHVTGVDKSRPALEVADANARHNGLANLDWIQGDVFDVLREFDAAGERYDTVVLDPPAFAKTRRAVEGALRGYRELNLRAMRMLRPGGTLVTCSCSHHVSPADFTGVVAAAAADSRRRVQLLETRGATPDHPTLPTLPESKYLKCLICRVG